MSTPDFTSFLRLMAQQKASDLFITAGMPPSMKVHGKISPITQVALTPQQSRDMVLNVMNQQQREEFEKTHESNFAIGVAIMISCAATRPPPTRLSSDCEITARNDSDSIERTIGFSPAGNTSMMRSTVLAADEVCSVPNTRWPVSAAVSARRMVSMSRISPTRM